MKTVAALALLLLAGVAIADDSNPCDSTGQSPYDYKQALCMSVLFYEAQRSGTVSNLRFDWREDSATDDGSADNVDLAGGYYDAGDFVKFGLPLAWSLTTLSWGVLSYKSGFNTAGQLSDAQDAIKWGTDYLLKAHTANGTLWGQVGDGNIDHAYWGRPEDMTMSRPSQYIDSSHAGTELSGETAAALAAASLVFADSDSSYSSKLLTAATDVFDMADNQRGTYTQSGSISNAAGFYDSYSGYEDELAWGACWMYKATKSSTYESKAKSFYTSFSVASSGYGFSWDNKMSGVMACMAEEFGGSYTTDLQSFLSTARSQFSYTPGGLYYQDSYGALRYAMNLAFIAFRAADLGADATTNQNFAETQTKYVLGSNGEAFMIGFGSSYPTRPHHRSSSCPYPPTSCTDGWAQTQTGANPHTLYGGMVGGPDNSDVYSNDRMDYAHCEVALDYNAGLTGCLAAMVEKA